MSTSLAITLSFMIGVPLVIGVVTLVVMWKPGTRLIALPLAVAAIIISAALVVPSANRCYESYRVNFRAYGLLTPAERETLETNQWICPVRYTFKRNGKETCLGFIGKNVGVGCG